MHMTASSIAVMYNWLLQLSELGNASHVDWPLARCDWSPDWQEIHMSALQVA